ncbi:PP2C family protein-serine/threonine phosphatase [Megalodesulfovibrio gigas]|uniref:PP2C family protein-serine/threonine phosphatase n=1 Tax=Megalodesulfovibrio gigas TaxID=879 RepID=UPI0003FC186B|nr:protein phosphatase 2C domain-containing protein [Megalodesulfovibrio gigas]
MRPGQDPIVEACGCTDQGRVRLSNQDAFFVDAEAGICILSDGMGGACCGEVASAVAVDSLRELLLPLQRAADAAAILPAADLPRPCGSSTYTCLAGPDAQPLQDAFLQANVRVHAESLRQPRCRGMGATASVVLLHRGHWLAANVGDSPIYLFRDRCVVPMHTTHSLEAELLRTGEPVDPEDMARARHLLTRAMGVERQVTADHCQMPARAGDIVCLCSDGLSNKVTPEEIMAICLNFPLRMACENLIMLANARGGEDNVTVIVCRLGMVQDDQKRGVIPFIGRVLRRLVGVSSGAALSLRQATAGPLCRSGARIHG